MFNSLFQVLFSCTNIGPIGHTESAWVLSRDRIPRGEVLQAAYGVLDKFKMNRSFFVKTDQTNCETLAPPLPAADQEVKSSEIDSDNEALDSSEESIEAVDATTVRV